MKRVIFLMVLVFAFAACSKQEKPKTDQTNKAVNPHATVHKVMVKEKTDAPPYSYLKVEENGKEYWMAVNQMNVKPGDYVYYSSAMTMQNFHSKTLNKTFKEILFVQDAKTVPFNASEKSTIAAAHSSIAKETKENVKITPLKDGVTIKEIYAKKNELAGKVVKVKGKVVKFNPNIMGRNWIHIQDGTDYNGKFDLLITSQDNVKVGDVIVAQGKVVTDKDFGAGYVYEVLLENGKVLK